MVEWEDDKEHTGLTWTEAAVTMIYSIALAFFTTAGAYYLLSHYASTSFTAEVVASLVFGYSVAAGLGVLCYRFFRLLKVVRDE